MPPLGIEPSTFSCFYDLRLYKADALPFELQRLYGDLSPRGPTPERPYRDSNSGYQIQSLRS